jgi:hypothetical protein
VIIHSCEDVGKLFDDLVGMVELLQSIPAEVMDMVRFFNTVCVWLSMVGCPPSLRFLMGRRGRSVETRKLPELGSEGATYSHRL